MKVEAGGGEGGDALKISSALPPPPPGLLQLCSYSPRGTGRGGEVPSRSIQNRRVGFTLHRIHFTTVIEFPYYMSSARKCRRHWQLRFESWRIFAELAGCTCFLFSVRAKDDALWAFAPEREDGWLGTALLPCLCHGGNQKYWGKRQRKRVRSGYFLKVRGLEVGLLKFPLAVS